MGDKGITLLLPVKLVQFAHIRRQEVEVVNEQLQVSRGGLAFVKDRNRVHDKNGQVCKHLPVESGEIGICLPLQIGNYLHDI